MKYLAVVVVVVALTSLTTACAQQCPDFVTVTNSTNLSDDYSKVKLLGNCPAIEKLPGEMHYHIIISEETDIAALTLTANQADNLLVPELTADGMTITFSEDWQGSERAVGAELVFRSGQIKALDIEGYSDHFFIDDRAGSLEEITDSGANTVIRVKSVSTGTIKIKHQGIGDLGFGDSGSVVVDAPNAVLDVEISGVEHDLRVKCKSISGEIKGTSDKLVVVSGEVTSIKMEGINNDVELGTESTGGCANVVKEGIGNDCNSNSDVTFEIEPMECKGPDDDFIECSGAFTTSAMLGLFMTTLTGLVAVLVGTWV